MKEKSIAQKAGKAVIWKAIQLAGAKVIFLLRTLILAAILVPEDFGLLAIALVSLDFLTKLTDVGLSQAIIQKNVENKSQYDSIWTIGVIRGFSLFLIIFLAAPLIASLFNEPRVVDLLRVLSLKPLIEELASIRIVELAKNLNFKSLAIIKIMEAVVNTVIAVILVSIFQIWALVFGILAGSLTYLILSYVLAPYKPKLRFEIASINSFISFGLWIFLSSFITIVANSAVQIIISRNLGAEALGLYYLSLKLGFLAVEVSSEVIGTVAFPLYSKIQKNFEKISFTWKAIIKGIMITYIPIACLIIAEIPYLIDYVLGIKWQGTISLIRLITAAGIFGIVGDAVVPILKATGRPDKDLIVGLIQYSLLLTGVIILINYFGIEGVALSWILAGIGSFIINLFFLAQMNLKPFEGLKELFFFVLVISLLSIFIALAIIRIFPGLIGFIFANCAALFSFVIIMLFINKKFNFGLIELLNMIFPKLNIPSGIKNYI